MTAEPTSPKPFCLRLPPFKSVPWQQWLPMQLSSLPSEAIDLDTGDWSLSCRDLEELLGALNDAGHRVDMLTTRCGDTLISAASLGLIARQAFSDSNNEGGTGEV